MKFVEAGVERSCEKSEPKYSIAMLPERAIQQRGQDRILGKVGAFANDELDRGDRRVRHIGRKPAHERANETRRVRGGEQVSRSDENENHPDENGQPVF